MTSESNELRINEKVKDNDEEDEEDAKNGLLTLFNKETNEIDSYQFNSFLINEIIIKHCEFNESSFNNNKNDNNDDSIKKSFEKRFPIAANQEPISTQRTKSLISLKSTTSASCLSTSPKSTSSVRRSSRASLYM